MTASTPRVAQCDLHRADAEPRLPKRSLSKISAIAILAVVGLVIGALLVSPSDHSKVHLEGSPVDLAQHHSAPIRREDIPPTIPTDDGNGIAGQEARELNAAIAFVPLGVDRPLPLKLETHDLEYDRAVDCLASALLYEAGDDPKGQSAVAQVVLNRVRHPAFPHSVCGVVYQGSERISGCQFTFTCDGALTRMPSLPAWHRARRKAADFLAGQTDPDVGMATHYHTDWVHPYWSDTLDKVARVETHLFFRWRGYWGSRSVFTARYSGSEEAQTKLSALSVAHGTAVAAHAVPVGGGTDDSSRQGSSSTVPNVLATQDGDHFILVEASDNGNELAMQGFDRCHGQTYCKVVAWDKRSAAYGSPQNPTIRTVAFLYVSDKRTGVEIALWDCARFNRPSETQCLSARNRRWLTFHGDLSGAS